jgi:hypothetical protein
MSTTVSRRVLLARRPKCGSDRVYHLQSTDGPGPRCDSDCVHEYQTMSLARARTRFGDLRCCERCQTGRDPQGPGERDCPFCGETVPASHFPEHLGRCGGVS